MYITALYLVYFGVQISGGCSTGICNASLLYLRAEEWLSI